MVISCNNTLWRTKQQRWLKYVDHIIVVGDPTLATKWQYNPETRVCRLQCKDDYLSLPSKVKLGFQFVSHTFDPPFLFKVDDDVMLRPDKIPTLEYDYAGMLSSNTIAYYCGGPLYYLSKKALTILKDMDPYYSTAEDVTVGYTLLQHGIYPTYIELYTNDVDKFNQGNSLALHDVKRVFFLMNGTTSYSPQIPVPEPREIVSPNNARVQYNLALQQQRTEFNTRIQSLQKRYHLIL